MTPRQMTRPELMRRAISGKGEKEKLRRVVFPYNLLWVIVIVNLFADVLLEFERSFW